MKHDSSVRAIVLAAGKGSRLQNARMNGPKLFLPVLGQTILEHQLTVLKSVGVPDVAVVLGYKGNVHFDHVARLGVRPFINDEFETTNMVASLLCADDLLNGSSDLLISYGDIVFEERIARDLISSSGPVSITVDLAWRRYWETRMSDPLSDAEILKMNDSRHVVRIGGRTRSFEDIQAQYIGLIHVKADFVALFWEEAGDLVARNPGVFMTELLQHLIDKGIVVQAIPTFNGWLEFDHPADLEIDFTQFWSPPTP